MDVKFYWCKGGGSDKVWGYFLGQETLYNFWGKRGAQLAFQQHPISKKKTFETKARSKVSKGYIEQIDESMIEAAWPDFAYEVENQLLIAKMGDTFRYQSEK